MDQLPEYGPAFAALNERQRKFVLAMASDPFGHHNDWAIAAGYSNECEAAKVTAHRLLQHEGIKAAAMEVARGTLEGIGPVLATAVLLREAKGHDPTRRLKAAEMIANRVGLHETQEIKVTHRDLTGDALLSRLAMVCEQLGVDVQKAIGSNVVDGRSESIIDAQAAEIPDGSEGQG